MAKCKICGEAVKAAPVLCPRCREHLAEIFCDRYCRFPREETDELALCEICASCPLVEYDL